MKERKRNSSFDGFCAILLGFALFLNLPVLCFPDEVMWPKYGYGECLCILLESNNPVTLPLASVKNKLLLSRIQLLFLDQTFSF